jgi:hypothetical protein
MQTTFRSLVTSLHGLLFGSLFLIALAAVALELLRQQVTLRSGELSPRGRLFERMAYVTMAAFGWIAVLLGTYAVYPWYRAKPPAGASQSASLSASLSAYPRSLLLSSPATAAWHSFGMEWKEHVGWVAPIVATMLAVVLTRHGDELRADKRLSRAVLAFACAGLLATAVAGFFGAMLDKTAPVTGGATYTVMGGRHD